MRFRNWFILLFLVLASIQTKAQLIDSIQKSIKKKAHFDFWLETRKSFISSRTAEFRGVKVAAAFNRNFYVGGGLNFLKANENNMKFSKAVYLPNEFGSTDTVFARLQMIYLSYFMEYVFYETHKWEFSVPVQFGIGGSWFEYNYKGVLYNRMQRHPIILYEPALSGEYMLFKWLGFGAHIGFRLMIVKNKKIPAKFTSPIYAFNINIHWGQLYKLAFPRSKLAKKF